MQQIELAKIRLDGGTQPRAEIVNEYVAAYDCVAKHGGHLIDYLSPEAIFADFTFIQDHDLKQRIQQRCMECGGHVAFIEPHPELGLVFHSLMLYGGMMMRKKIAADFEGAKKNPGGEKQIEDQLCHQLARNGIAYRRQVRCYFGIVDVVTESHIYEVKQRLDRSSVIHAVGQVLCYRSTINPSLTPVIVGPPCRSAKATRRMLASFGVRLLEIQPEKEATNGN